MTNFSNGELKEKQLIKKMKELGFEDEEITNKTAVGIGLWKEAVKGNVNAYKEYMALIGEANEVNFIEVNKGIINIAELINNPVKNRTEKDVDETNKNNS